MFTDTKTVMKCIEAFNFDGLAKYLNTKNLILSGMDVEGYTEGVTGLELYYYVRDLVLEANEAFGDIAKIKKTYNALNIYESDDGIFTIEIQSICRNHEVPIDTFDEESLKFQFKQSKTNEKDRWIEIDYISFGQFPGYMA